MIKIIIQRDPTANIFKKMAIQSGVTYIHSRVDRFMSVAPAVKNFVRTKDTKFSKLIDNLKASSQKDNLADLILQLNSKKGKDKLQENLSNYAKDLNDGLRHLMQNSIPKKEDLTEKGLEQMLTKVNGSRTINESGLIALKDNLLKIHSNNLSTEDFQKGFISHFGGLRDTTTGNSRNVVDMSIKSLDKFLTLIDSNKRIKMSEYFHALKQLLGNIQEVFVIEALLGMVKTLNRTDIFVESVGAAGGKSDVRIKSKNFKVDFSIKSGSLTSSKGVYLGHGLSIGKGGSEFSILNNVGGIEPINPGSATPLTGIEYFAHTIRNYIALRTRNWVDDFKKGSEKKGYEVSKQKANAANLNSYYESLKRWVRMNIATYIGEDVDFLISGSLQEINSVADIIKSFVNVKNGDPNNNYETYIDVPQANYSVLRELGVFKSAAAYFLTPSADNPFSSYNETWYPGEVGRKMSDIAKAIDILDIKVRLRKRNSK